MGEEIPQWAKDRAESLLGATSDRRRIVDSFAAYIAAHEEPPVDPLLVEVQDLADELTINLSAMPWVERVLLAALRRGMELAREQSK